MRPLPDLALQAILKEWNPEGLEYDPPNTDVREWTNSIASLCDTYGIPDIQRPQCAAKFIKGELRNELEKVLEDGQARFGPIHWAQYQEFMVAFDQKFRERWDELPFYKKHPKRTGAAIGLIGSTLLLPVAAVGLLTAVGFTSAGVAAGSIAATIQSIVYGGAAGGLFSLLQSAGATMVLPSVGTIFAGAATTGAGVVVMNSESVPLNPGELLSNSDTIAGQYPGGQGSDSDGKGDDDNDGKDFDDDNEDYLLTSQAIQAFVKSWDVTAYNPPGTGAAGWLRRIHNLCEAYGVPGKQRALISMHRMRADCRNAAHAAGCFDTNWDQFKTWLLQYDEAMRASANRRSAELLKTSMSRLGTE